MSLKDNKSAIFFQIGAIGYIAGFLAWFTWFLLVILNLVIYWLGYGYPDIMSGIFFQHGPYSLFVYSFFSASFLLGSFACFGLKRRLGSNMALICGLTYIGVFIVLCYYIMELYFFRNYQNYISLFLNTLRFMNLGLMVWGATLLGVRTSLPHPRLSLFTAIIFAFVAILTLTMFWAVILYWGIEFWLMMFGWLYAIGAIATAIILICVSKQK